MKRYFIEEAKCDITDGGFACGPVPGNVVVTIKFREGDKTQWLSMVEADGTPNVYLADRDIHDDLVAEDMDDVEFTKYMEDHFVWDFNGIEVSPDYNTVFESMMDDPENSAIPFIKYMIALIRCSMDDLEELIEMAKGKYADELDIPVSDVEEDYLWEHEQEEDDEEDNENEDNEELIDTDYSDKQSIFYSRLMIEANIENPHVYSDMENIGERERKTLTKLEKACSSEEEYQKWKEDVIKENVKDIVGEEKIITCDYIFAGIGQYKEIIPESMLDSFKCWIDGNGSAFFGGYRDATDKEIKLFVARTIANSYFAEKEE